MARVTRIVSVSLPPSTLSKLDQARGRGSRSGFIADAVTRVIADSAPTKSRSSIRMSDDTDTNDSRKHGTVVDRHLAKHGSVPEPKYRRPTGEAEVPDHELSHLGPPRAREF